MSGLIPLRHFITRSKSQSVVMISLDDYEALQETSYLLRSPKNARRLLESVTELEQGGGLLQNYFNVMLIN
ncbi:type II toxin-antitoxin system prevent-host-death family antitoxin [Aliidiomarina iranensis]|uniref:Antitoxin n=2 Tax=Aliidiomarina iranensis TaxID=1434071 RepID=A0A432W2W2_9GAMM|nr:type II toxin-antitoxin system prevent-host-death family antitoxin [Aliidiomarina iranensis]